MSDAQINNYVNCSAGKVTSNRCSNSLIKLCPHCRFKSNSISELRKHFLKHEKSHKCDLPNCARGDRGFGTVNDLERHKKSKHGIKPRHGATKSYRCASKRCKMSYKLWPRLDNFKQHVKRVHKDENMHELVVMSEHTEMPSTLILQGKELDKHGDIPPTSAVPHIRTTVDASSAQSDESQLISKSKGTQVNSNKCISSCTSRDHDEVQRTETERQKVNIDQHFKDIDVHDSISFSIMSTSAFSIFSAIHIDSQKTTLKQVSYETFPYSRYKSNAISKQCDSYIIIANTRPLKATSFVGDAGEKFGRKSYGIDRAGRLRDEKTFISVRPVAWNEKGYRCQWPISSVHPTSKIYTDVQSKSGPKFYGKICKKPLDIRNPALMDENNAISYNSVFPSLHASAMSSISQIEGGPGKCYLGSISDADISGLRKLSRQLITLYGCTFPDCYRIFRNRNSWRRHESGQHFQLESWRCHLPKSLLNQRSCAKVFFRAEAFRNHVYEHHELRGSPQLALECWKSRVGRNGQGSFWCGFCKDILQLHGRAIAAWEERFRHIEAHYRAGQTIDTWLCVLTDRIKR